MIKSAVLMGLVFLSGCATDSKYSAMKEVPGYDRRVNIHDVRQIRQMDRTPVEDTQLIRYVQNIRSKLEQAHGKPCDCVVIVDSFSGYEAFSLSPYTIEVTAGLIAQADSEDEIASVIAHELGHIYANDTSKGWVQGAAIDAAKIGSWAAGAGGYTMLLGDSVQSATKGIIYNRWNAEQEIKADQFASQLLLNAGYSLNGQKMAVRRLTAFGAGAEGARKNQIGNCLVRQGSALNLNYTACAQKMTDSEKSVYQSKDDRLKQVMKAAWETKPEQRRRRPGPPPPRFASVDYLFSMNDLVSDDRTALEKGLKRIESLPVPPTLHGNVAVTNRLAVAQLMLGNEDKAGKYLLQSINSQGRTSWTFNQLYKLVDRQNDPKSVEKAILDSTLEIGYSSALLPVEYYLAKRHKLQILEVVSWTRCLSNYVDDINTAKRCKDFENYANSSGPANW